MKRGGRKRFLSTVSALVLSIGSSFSSCSPEPIERNYFCTDAGCRPVPQESVSTEESVYPRTKEEYSSGTLETIVSSQSGTEVVLGETIHVVDQYYNSLSQITIHGLAMENKKLFVATDLLGNHYPALASKEFSFTQSGLQTSRFSQQKTPLTTDDIVTMVLETVQWGEKVLEKLTSSEGDFLGTTDSTSFYCMTTDQMKQNYLLIPTGIVVMALPESTSSNVLKIAKGMIVSELLTQFLYGKYGKHEGYLVAVPTTGVNLCGGNTDPVCTLSTEQLSAEVWSKTDIPYWEIRGSCIPATKTSSSQERRDRPQDERTASRERTLEEDTLTDSSSGLQWQKNSSPGMMTRAEAIAFCNSIGYDNKLHWRLPSKKEMKTIMNFNGSCLLPTELNGPCEKYWLADDTCVYASEPHLQVDFSQGLYPFECVPSWAEAYVRCVRTH
ncbi:DUF1566 domain-containing protein [Candidatus Woesearchaeota archaeon]|nr:DUF1566 domain-containing protein [Candidatus Woesearchaeota archaeon]